MQYGVILQWSAEDEAFIAEVPELSGCAADDETYQEALSNVEVIIEEWIETADEELLAEALETLRSYKRDESGWKTLDDFELELTQE